MERLVTSGSDSCKKILNNDTSEAPLNIRPVYQVAPEREPLQSPMTLKELHLHNSSNDCSQLYVKYRDNIYDLQGVKNHFSSRSRCGKNLSDLSDDTDGSVTSEDSGEDYSSDEEGESDFDVDIYQKSLQGTPFHYRVTGVMKDELLASLGLFFVAKLKPDNVVEEIENLVLELEADELSVNATPNQTLVDFAQLCKRAIRRADAGLAFHATRYQSIKDPNERPFLLKSDPEDLRSWIGDWGSFDTELSENQLGRTRSFPIVLSEEADSVFLQTLRPWLQDNYTPFDTVVEKPSPIERTMAGDIISRDELSPEMLTTSEKRYRRMAKLGKGRRLESHVNLVCRVTARYVSRPDFMAALQNFFVVMGENEKELESLQ